MGTAWKYQTRGCCSLGIQSVFESRVVFYYYHLEDFSVVVGNIPKYSENTETAGKQQENTVEIGHLLSFGNNNSCTVQAKELI